MMWQPLLMSSLVIAIVDSTQPCKSTYSARGRYLKDHVISTEKVKNIGACYVECSKDPRCKSINFHFQDLICELNDDERINHPWDYVLKEGQAYLDNKMPFKEYVMTPLWLQAHTLNLSSPWSATTDQITFNAGSITNEALLKVPLISAGDLTDSTPLTVEITVANDVSIAQAGDSDISYGLSDGTNFIGFETPDQRNYNNNAPCYGTEAQSGESKTSGKYFLTAPRVPKDSIYPDQFVFTLNLDTPQGWCSTAHGSGFIRTAKYSRRLVLSQGLTLEVYKGNNGERVGVKYIKVTIMKMDD